MNELRENEAQPKRAPSVSPADCQRVSDALLGPRPRAGSVEALREHARACPSCAALLAHDDALRALLSLGAAEGAADPASEGLPPALAEALARDHAPVRRRSIAARFAPPFALGLALAATALSLAPRCDLAEQRRGDAGFDVVRTVLVLGIVAALLMVSARGRYGLGVDPRTRMGVVLVGVAGFIALAAATTHPVEGSLHFQGAHAWLFHALCFSIGTAVSALVCFVGARAARRTEARSPATAGLTLGLAGGLTGALVLQSVCAFAEPLHYALGHGAAVVAGPIVGVLLAQRKLAI